MSDLFDSRTVCKLFSLKLFSLSLKIHMNMFDLNYKFINESFAFNPD